LSPFGRSLILVGSSRDAQEKPRRAKHDTGSFLFAVSINPQRGHGYCAADHGHQNSNRNANCISRGVPEPTGVMGDTMAVFKFTVLMMLPNPLAFEGLNVDCG